MVTAKKKGTTAYVPPKLEDDLQAQHQYVKNQKKKDNAFSLIAPDTFIKSIRDLGYKSNLTALDELIDNSVQAGGRVIDIFLAYKPDNKSRKKPDYIIVADDGHGMHPDMIRLAVKWGGTHRPDDRSGYGRYGFGLPSACVSIGRRYSVFSKEPGQAWWAVTVDIDEVIKKVEEGEPLSPVARQETPPAFVKGQIEFEKLESGTIIVIETLDRVETGFKTTSGFDRNMKEHIGVIYRKQIPTVTFQVNGDPVEPVDPLFLDENARWHDLNGVKAQAIEPIDFELPGTDGRTGRVRIRGAWFPFNFHLKDPQGAVKRTNHNERFKILKDYNGILVCRAGRQIDVVRQLPWSFFTFINFDRHWKVEIDFDPVLDEFFGVTTHKQQIVFSESLAGHLEREGFLSLLTDLRRKMRQSRNEVLAALEKNNETLRPSEEALFETQDRKAPLKPSPKQLKKAEENLEREARKQAQITGEKVEKAKERLEQETNAVPYKVDFEAMTDGPIYRGERLGKQYRLILNTAHRFYSDVYEPAKRVPGLCSKIEAFLFVYAEAELDAGEQQETFYKAARIYSSQRLTDVLAELDGVAEREDEASAEMEAEETAAN